jgi:periplasmic copper chaperone A
MMSYARSGLALAAITFAAAVSFAVPASAHDYSAGDLKISHPWARMTVPGAKVGAGYLKVANTGAAPDRLVSVETPAADRVEIHESLEENGVARMRPLKDGVALAAGADAELKPGGMHLMLMGLKQQLVAGQKVPATLVFEQAGRLDVELSVEDMSFGGAAAVKESGGHAHH